MVVDAPGTMSRRQSALSLHFDVDLIASNTVPTDEFVFMRFPSALLSLLPLVCV